MNLREKILASKFIRMGSSVYLDPANIKNGLKLSDTIEQIQDEIIKMAKDGLLEVKIFKDEVEPKYLTTLEVFKAKELVLNKYKLRRPPLLYQKKYKVEDLLIGLAASKAIQNSRITGPYFGQGEFIIFDEMSTILFQYTPAELFEACITLEEKKLITIQKVDIANKKFERYSLLGLGLMAYDEEVKIRLHLGKGEALMDINSATTIDIFWSWQSDFPTSSDLVSVVLNEVTVELNKNPKLIRPVRVTPAVLPGDGAINISEELKKKIQECTFFVADVTTIFTFKGKMFPNSNVLIELGYALAKKPANQIIIIEMDRPYRKIPGKHWIGFFKSIPLKFPFDLDQIQRIKFKTDKELKEKLSMELREMLKISGKLHE